MAVEVKQAHSISTTLFNIALDEALKIGALKKAIMQSLARIMGYADDLTLIARNQYSFRGLVTICNKRSENLRFRN